MNDLSRRSFLKASGAVAAAACIGGDHLMAERLKLPIGLQLYSVRNLLPKNFEGTLQQLGAAGYKEVEAAGYFDKTAAELGNALQKAGLKCISTHHQLGQLKTQFDQLIEYGQALGLEYIICSWAGVHRDPTRTGDLNLDDWRYVADQFNEIGRKVKGAGMTFGYHNHIVEFGRENGVVFFDELLKRTDPKLVEFEMDCGWVTVGGGDPVAYLHKYPNRISMLHLKDFKKAAKPFSPTAPPVPTELGRGSIDYGPIFAAAKKGTIKHYFVEQEAFDVPWEESLKIDADYLRKL